LNGEIRFSGTNGDLDLSIPASTSAEFSAFADNGTISSSNLVIKDREQTGDSLTGTLGDGEGIIELLTVNGNIRVVGID
jgi:hypothetical protein